MQAVVLWGRDKLAADAVINADKTCTFGGIVLAHNVASREEVDRIVNAAAGAGNRYAASALAAPDPTTASGCRVVDEWPRGGAGRIPGAAVRRLPAALLALRRANRKAFAR